MIARWARPLAACFLVVALSGYELAAYAAALPDLVDSAGLGLAELQAGIIASAAMAGMLAGGLGSTRLTRRHRPSTLLRGASAAMGAGLLTSAVASGPWMLGAGRLLTGLGAGVAVPAAITLTAAVAPRRRRTAVHTVMFSGLQLGSAFGAVIGPGVLDAAGWRPMFGIGAGAAACLLALLPRLVADEAGPADAPPAPGLGALLRVGTRRLTVVHWASTALGLLVIYGLNAWLVQLMLGAGHGPSASLHVLACYNLGAVLGAPLAGLAADRWGQRRTVVVLFAAGAAALAALAREPSSDLTIGLIWVAGLGTMGATTILNSLTAASYPDDLRAGALSWALGIGRLGAVVGPIYGGFLLQLCAAPPVVLAAFAVPTGVTAALVATSGPPTCRSALVPWKDGPSSSTSVADPA